MSEFIFNQFKVKFLIVMYMYMYMYGGVFYNAIVQSMLSQKFVIYEECMYACM